MRARSKTLSRSGNFLFRDLFKSTTIRLTLCLQGSLMATRILITGGAGFIGTHLAAQLHRDGESVVILDNLLPQVHGPNPEPNLPDCETVWADVRDQEALDRALKNVEVVHHFA